MSDDIDFVDGIEQIDISPHLKATSSSTSLRVDNRPTSSIPISTQRRNVLGDLRNVTDNSDDSDDDGEFLTLARPRNKKRKPPSDLERNPPPKRNKTMHGNLESQSHDNTTLHGSGTYTTNNDAIPSIAHSTIVVCEYHIKQIAFSTAIIYEFISLSLPTLDYSIISNLWREYMSNDVRIGELDTFVNQLRDHLIIFRRVTPDIEDFHKSDVNARLANIVYSAYWSTRYFALLHEHIRDLENTTQIRLDNFNFPLNLLDENSLFYKIKINSEEIGLNTQFEPPSLNFMDKLKKSFINSIDVLLNQLDAYIGSILRSMPNVGVIDVDCLPNITESQAMLTVNNIWVKIILQQAENIKLMVEKLKAFHTNMAHACENQFKASCIASVTQKDDAALVLGFSHYDKYRNVENKMDYRIRAFIYYRLSSFKYKRFMKDDEWYICTPTQITCENNNIGSKRTVNTHYWRIHENLEKFLDIMMMTDSQAEEEDVSDIVQCWQDNRLKIIHAIKTIDNGCLPIVKPERYYYSFKNGIYYTKDNIFYHYNSALFQKMPYELDTYNYIDKCFDITGFDINPITFKGTGKWIGSELDCENIISIITDTVLRTQEMSRDDTNAIWAMMLGRALYSYRTLETYQFATFLAGPPNTGKSLISSCVRACFPEHRVGIISSASGGQSRFNLEMFVNKDGEFTRDILLETDSRSNTNRENSISLTDLLKMISHECIYIDKKHKTGIMTLQWIVPLFLVGNEFLKYFEDHGAINRRFMIVELNIIPRTIVPFDDKDILESTPNFIKKANISYLYYLKKLESKRITSIFDILPETFRKNSLREQANDNRFYFFLNDSTWIVPLEVVTKNNNNNDNNNAVHSLQNDIQATTDSIISRYINRGVDDQQQQQNNNAQILNTTLNDNINRIHNWFLQNNGIISYSMLLKIYKIWFIRSQPNVRNNNIHFATARAITSIIAQIYHGKYNSISTYSKTAAGQTLFDFDDTQITAEYLKGVCLSKIAIFEYLQYISYINQNSKRSK